MALKKIGERDVVLKSSGEDGASESKPARKVLDEDTYAKGLEKIIVRDFFPDLQLLQSSYRPVPRSSSAAAVNKNAQKDVTAPTYETPAEFETPSVAGNDTPFGSATIQTTDNDSQQSSSENNPKVHLDKYLAKNTTEDNESFQQILNKYDDKQREKYSWLYDAEIEQREQSSITQVLPAIEDQAQIESTQSLQSWNYCAKNALMYVPEGVPDEELKKAKARVIEHTNTRFSVQPFSTVNSKQSIADTATEKAKSMQGKIGLDGKEVLPQQSPTVRGFGFVGTPSPAPGVNESPLMTWGEIEGTPFRLDGSATPIRTPGPTFKIPNVPKRDRLALELADKASKSRKAKKEEALQQANRLKFTSPGQMSSKTDRLGYMSPAAQRLASAKLGIRTGSDKALRASYTPSPHRTPSERRHNLKSPSVRTPTAEKRREGKLDSDEPLSLTDNLLQLPKRRKAQDFF